MLSNELVKNAKVIIRNWSSLLLLILGPLAMMLIIGLTFSADDVHDITIGMSGNTSMLPIMNSNISTFVSFTRTADCIRAVETGTVKLCIDVVASEEENVRINFIFDPSEKKTANLIITHLKSIFGARAADISLEATQSLLDRIDELVAFLVERNSDLDVVVHEANITREQLTIRLDRLTKLRDTLAPHTASVQDLAKALNASPQSINTSVQVLSIVNALDDVFFLATISLPPPIVPTRDILEINATSTVAYFVLTDGSIVKGSLTNESVTSAITLYTLSRAHDQLSVVYNASIALDSRSNEFESRVRNASTILKQSISLLDEEIDFNEAAIQKIDLATLRIAMIRDDFSTNLVTLSSADPNLASRIARPFVELFTPARTLTNVQSVFPGLVIIVIVFITLLFANILTLSEIHSAAYFRNLIAPVNPRMYTIGLLITNVILVLLQVGVLLLIGQTQLDIPVLANVFSVFVLAMILAIIFSCIGAFIAFIIKGEHSSVLTTTFVALGFYLFSNLVTPLEFMPRAVSIIAQYNPVVIGEIALRRLLLFGVPIMMSHMLALFAWALIGLILIFVAQYRFMRRSR